MRHARDAVHRLLEYRASPAAWARCGADAERLAALGFTLADLVQHSHVLLEHVVDGLDLTWDRLQALGFHASMLAAREHYPVSVLARAGLTAERLLRTPSVSYETLALDYKLSHEELRFLGFDAPLLMQLGMSGEHVFAALAHPHVRPRGTEWWVRTMRCTPELLEELFSRADVSCASNDDKVVYASLVVSARAVNNKHGL